MKKVIILYGGRSVEHGVSVNSAKNIFEQIDRNLFEPVPVGITQDGRWFLTPVVHRDISQGKALGLILDAVQPGFTLMSSGDRIKADIIFPVLHGTDGEDGSIQGLIKSMDIPMVGTGVLGSAVSINKIVAKQLLVEAGIPTSKFIAFQKEDRKKIKFDEVEKQLGLPFMVKAACLGSSVGVNKVNDPLSFKKALDEAFQYDTSVIIEEFIEGRELECAVLGNTPPETSLPGEVIVSSKYDFYTFDAKYVDESAVTIEVPAKIDTAISEKIRSLCVQSFQALHCADFARVDVFLTKKGKVYINEINTIPGFTNASMFPVMWKERGISFTELITRLIDVASKRHQEAAGVHRAFQSTLKF